MASLPVLSLSEYLGYTSIGCWLCAQLPQFIKNLKRQSTDGLSFPFLVNWYLGDLSNLFGCILTHQLPFQTYLASYFVFIDSVLFIQYFYYDRTEKQNVLPIHSPRRNRSGSYDIRHQNVDRIGSRYRALSAVAANVAATAALAAQQDELNNPRPRWHRSPFPNRETSASRSKDPAGSDVEEEALAAMADSFHSEGGQLSGRKRVSWDSKRFKTTSRSPVIPQNAFSASMQLCETDSPTEVAGSSERGRPLQRDPNVVDRKSVSAIRRNSRAGTRRGAGMVFLGAFSFFSIGALTANQRFSSTSSLTHGGKVLSGTSMHHATSVLNHSYQPSADTSFLVYEVFFKKVPTTDGPREEYPPPKKLSRRRILGRIFAWVCTTLYLTSRLPQIWMNYTRKSVEGLSTYLFVFAFLGNIFYVLSILTNNLPPAEAMKYLIESIPYLIGSGGTLFFDITIVSQSFVYRRKQEAGRRISQEEVGLLAEDA